MADNSRRPNVILVMTDDQGYADLGCTGNPWIHTPNIDAFASQSVRCEDFHVQPLCTPTRGAIMTGRRPASNGAWATCWGRSLLDVNETTLADVFSRAGYRTGMFGKWHLGDNCPYRPQDRGFEHVVAHKGGGVGQTPDFWGNDYFNDTYFHNGEPVEHVGYCTDVWFEQAQSWIRDVGDEPFFCYLATNAPHDPYLVADHYREMYEGNDDICSAAFYGMITNIDEDFGKLRRTLRELAIEDNTILIFMTDNGSSGGAWTDDEQFPRKGYNAGMRGTKGSFYDGGHRVPFFMRWTGGGLESRTVEEMCLDVDLLPTFAELCGFSNRTSQRGDGVSIAPLLRGDAEMLKGDRVHFLLNEQGTTPPEKWQGATMTRQWRLVGRDELYNIQVDPGQRMNVAGEFPNVVARLRDAYEQWYETVAPGMVEYCPIAMGDPKENPTRLDAMDVMGDVVWHQTQIEQAIRCAGEWTVSVARPGRYRFRLRRWPEELGAAIDETVEPRDRESEAYAPAFSDPMEMHPTGARVKVADQEQTVAIEVGDVEAMIEMDLVATDRTTLEAYFTSDDDAWGAYYVYVERMEVGG